MPIIIPQEPDKCPNCKQNENLKTVCRNCGHEYEDEPLTFGDWVIFISIFVLAIWLIITLGCWLLEGGSLIKIISNQFEHLTKLKL